MDVSPAMLVYIYIYIYMYIYIYCIYIKYNPPNHFNNVHTEYHIDCQKTKNK